MTNTSIHIYIYVCVYIFDFSDFKMFFPFPLLVARG